MNNDQIRDRAIARLRRLKPGTGHYKVLCGKLGISDLSELDRPPVSAPKPVVEEKVEPVVEKVKAPEKAPEPVKKERKFKWTKRKK